MHSTLRGYIAVRGDAGVYPSAAPYPLIGPRPPWLLSQNIGDCCKRDPGLAIAATTRVHRKRLRHVK